MKNMCKKKRGSEYKTDWVSVAALVPGRTRGQCWSRWQNALDPSIGRKGKWTADEDSKLKDAVHTHRGKNWGFITALVPGRTEKQCNKRWHDVLDPSIDRTNERTGKWTAVEDSKLKDAVQAHGENNWPEVAALVPGRMRIQCYNRWRDALDPSIVRAIGHTGKWTADQDIKLKDAVLTHGGKNWGAIAARVPGRTEKQCNRRWERFR
jgi:myb proto-oncogene protein